MKACLCVGLGGALGSILRYLISSIPASGSFPVKTLFINVIGSFFIGLITAFFALRSSFEPNLLLFLKVGICGGFTTFSTFALESTTLLQNGKTEAAFLYMVLSVVLSLGAIFFAQSLAMKL